MTENLNLPAKSADLTPEDYTKAMQAAGLLPASASGASFSRVKMDGQTLLIDNEPFPYNPKTNEPNAIILIQKAPIQHYAKWIPSVTDDGGALARAIGRPEAAGTMCKTWDADKYINERKAEDGTACVTCPVNPNVQKEDLPPEAQGQKCGWKGDLEFRLFYPETKEVSEQIHTLTLSATGMIEWLGTSKDRERGAVTDMNGMQKLARLATAKFPDVEPFTAIMKAQTALSLGGVLAEIRILRAENKGNRWSVPSITPIDILDVTETPALPESAPEGGAAEAEAGTDPLPF